MKKCPHCKKPIEENARFCLYCMNSLDEKQDLNAPKKSRKPVYITVCVCAAGLAVVLASVLLAGRGSVTPVATLSGVFNSSDSSGTASVDGNSKATRGNTTSGSTAATRTGSSDLPHDTPASSSSTGGGVSSARSTTSTGSNKSGSTAANASSGIFSSDTVSKTAASSSAVSVSSGTKTSSAPSAVFTSDATYNYRQAKSGDDFYVHYTITENDIVITSVNTPSSNGVYMIPDKIDGKNVLAVMGLAFSASSVRDTVKTVVVPASVKTIWDNAFGACYGLTDVYLRGEAVYIRSNAFPDVSKRTGALTIHCSATCQNRNFYYYSKSSQSLFNADYKEWNG